MQIWKQLTIILKRRLCLAYILLLVVLPVALYAQVTSSQSSPRKELANLVNGTLAKKILEDLLAQSLADHLSFTAFKRRYIHHTALSGNSDGFALDLMALNIVSLM